MIECSAISSLVSVTRVLLSFLQAVLDQEVSSNIDHLLGVSKSHSLYRLYFASQQFFQ